MGEFCISHEFQIFSKSGLSSWVVVINLIELSSNHKVFNIWVFTSLVESVLYLMWMSLLEVIGVEVVIDL